LEAPRSALGEIRQAAPIGACWAGISPFENSRFSKKNRSRCYAKLWFMVITSFVFFRRVHLAPGGGAMQAICGGGTDTNGIGGGDQIIGLNPRTDSAWLVLYCLFRPP